ncbi:hypothetical protein [Rhodoferax fermentans]|nr:hypothetical protein [Rhodoferax fermentans]
MKIFSIHITILTPNPAPSPAVIGHCRRYAHLSKNERRGCPLWHANRASTVTAWQRGNRDPLSVKFSPVDNFYSASFLLAAEKIGIVDKVFKCLKSMKNPVNVRKVMHNAQ